MLKSKKSRPKKSQIKINENVQEVRGIINAPNRGDKVASSDKPPSPAPVQKVVKDKQPPVQQAQPPKEVVKSYEDMRKDRLKERLKQREERNINLFKQVL